MSNLARQLTQSHDRSAKVAEMLQTGTIWRRNPSGRDRWRNESMRIVRENAPVEKIARVKAGSMPTAVIEIDMTRAQAIMRATRIDGLIRKGRRQHAWVRRWRE